MEAKIPNSTVPPSSVAAIFVDHCNLPLEGEMSMKNSENDDGGKNSVMEATQLEIEMEKKKIREEIIASELLTGQKLEAEVRMELMEKQIMGGSDDEFDDRLKLINTSVGGVENLQQIKSGPIESNVFEDGEKEKHGVDLGKLPSEPSSSLVAAQVAEKEQHDVALEKLPSGTSSTLVAAQVAGKPMNGFGDEEVLDQAMPCSGLSGAKRKDETLESSDKETASVASKEVQKKKWYCSLCEVAATSAGTLNLHIHGKKHKAKEALSKSCGTASNSSMDSNNNLMQPVEKAKAHVQPMEEQRTQMQLMEEEGVQVKPMEEENPMEEEDVQVKPMEVDKSQAQPVEGDKNQGQLMEEEKPKKLECTLCQVSATSEVLLRSHFEGKKHKAKEAKLGISQQLSEAKGKVEVAHKWYCSICNVSAASENNLKDHLQGKKHKAKAGLLPPEADSIESNPTEKILDDMNITLEKSSEGDKAINEQTSVDTLGFDGDSSNSKGIKRKANDKEVIESEESEEIGKEMIHNVVKVWLCKTCNEEVSDEAEMAIHKKSTKHMDKIRKIGGGLIVVSGMLKEEVESEKDTENTVLKAVEGTT